MVMKKYLQTIVNFHYHWLNYLVFLFVAGLFFTPILLQAAAGILLLVLIVSVFHKKWHPFSTIHYLIFCYAVSAIISFLISGQMVKEIPKFLPHFILLSYIPISIYLSQKIEVKSDHWSGWIILCAGFAGLVGVLNFALGKDRTTSTFGGYFTLAALMGWSIPLTVGYFLKARSGKALWYIPLLFLQLLALWFTFTRSAFLGLFAGFAVWFFRMLPSIPHLSPNDLIKRISIFLLPLLLLLLIFFSSDRRINPIGEGDPSQSSAVDLSSGRKDIILAAIKIISTDFENLNVSRILLGHGLSSYQRLVTGPYTCWESDYLEIFMNQGLIGLVILLLLYFYFIKAIWKGLRSRQILLNSLAISGVIFLVMSFFTLKLTSWHSGGIFLITLLMLEFPSAGSD